MLVEGFLAAVFTIIYPAAQSDYGTLIELREKWECEERVRYTLVWNSELRLARVLE